MMGESTALFGGAILSHVIRCSVNGDDRAKRYMQSTLATS